MSQYLLANRACLDDTVVFAGTLTSPAGNMTDGYFVRKRELSLSESPAN